MALPIKLTERFSSGIKRFQPILAAAKARDVGEADTSTIVKDILSDLFGYDKYSEITAEFQIKSTYCDLAIKLDGKLHILIEVKSIGSDLKDAHAKQAVDYAANQGVEWVVLTNGMTWRVYRVIFAQPISQELVVEWDFCNLSPRNTDHLDTLHLLSKEGHCKSLLDDFHEQKQAMSRFFLGALIVSQPVLDVMRRELKRMSPGVKIDTTEIEAVLIQEVIKREVFEGDKASEAKRKFARAQAKAATPKMAKAAPEEKPAENAEPE